MVDRAGKALINVNVLAAYCFFCDGALTGGGDGFKEENSEGIETGMGGSI